MSRDNKKARKKLEKIYGKGCFIERMGIRKIKGVKPIDKTITYHHLKKRSEGGKATVENGANLAWENHAWLHSLPEAQQKDLNNRIREWKLNYLIERGGDITQHGSIDLTEIMPDDECITIKLEDNVKEQNIEERAMQEKATKQKFNRAKIKRITQQLIEEMEEDEMEL